MARQAIFWVVAVAAGVLGLSGPGIGSAVAPVLAASAGPKHAAAINDRALIASIQELLTALGYNAGPADGVAGQRTRRAILVFQHRIGIPADGHPSEALYARLTRTLNHGDGGRPGERPAGRAAGHAEPPMRARPLTAAIPMDAVAATLAATAPAAGTPSTAKPASTDRVRDVAPPIDREILNGVRWRVTDSNGASFELLLEAGGRVGGTALAQFWHWARSGDTIRLIFDNQWGGRVIRTGHFVGDGIVGTAEGNGLKWRWKAVRLTAKPDRAAWTSTP